jgi:hypothetical protein
MVGLLPYLLGGAALLAVGAYGMHRWDEGQYAIALSKQQAAQIEAQHNAILDAVAYQIAEDAANFDVGKKVVEYRDRVVTNTITLTREIPKYVTPEASAACVVPRGFIELHNRAATGPIDSAAAVPDATSGAVNADSHVGIDTLGAALVANYGRCNEALERSNVAWPEWYAKAKAAYDEWAKKR